MTLLTTTATTFSESLANALFAQTAAIAARWRERASAAAPRPFAVEAGNADADGVVRAFITSLQKDARWFGEVMRSGWEAGAAAHQAGLAPHHLLTDAELLTAILLAAAEQYASQGDATGTLPPVATAADGIGAARRLQRAGAIYTHAAVASFLHAIVTALRARYRILRHDLRNPVGTIRGALALMDDETVPTETRLGPNVRAMVVRNAVSLDRLIAANLGDATADALLGTPQETSLRDLALATRRALREPARLAGCDIVVATDLPAARVDAVGVELTLSALLLAGLACADAADVFRVEAAFDERPDHDAGEGSVPRSGGASVTLRLVHERSGATAGGATPDDLASLAAADAPLRPRAPSWEVHGLDLAASVAVEFGGRIGGAPPDGSGHKASRHRVRRHPYPVDSASLAELTTLFVEFPVLSATADGEGVASASHGGSVAAGRAAGAGGASTRTPAASAGAVPAASPRHQRDDVARAD